MSVEEDTIEGGEAETSLRDDLASALSDIQARETAPADTPPAASAEDTSPARGDGRDDKGRFAGKSAEAAAPAAEVDAPKPEAAPADNTDVPPSSWRSTAAAKWADLPAEVKAEAHRREREIATLTGRQDSERLFGKEIADIFRPFAEDIHKANATPQLALQTLLNNHKALRSQNPQERVAKARELLMDYGIDPRALAQPDPNMPQDPHVINLMREIDHLKGRLNQPQQQQYAPLPAAENDANVQPDIDAFRSDPAHPHFDQVSGHMAALIESGAASDLESAYQMAVLANPALRSTLLAPPAPDAQRSQEKVAAARQAGVSVQGSPGTTAPAKPATLRDELRENLRQFGIG